MSHTCTWLFILAQTCQINDLIICLNTFVICFMITLFSIKVHSNSFGHGLLEHGSIESWVVTFLIPLNCVNDEDEDESGFSFSAAILENKSLTCENSCSRWGFIALNVLSSTQINSRKLIGLHNEPNEHGLDKHVSCFHFDS